MRKSSQAGQQLGASFRDPAGFLFTDSQGRLCRQINKAGAEDFDFFISSGLYDDLKADQRIVSHKKVDNTNQLSSGAHAVIQPELIPLISYPFEWSFSQLKDAALLTIDIQKKALTCGMTLKDASAYNVQFLAGKPIFIDTLSFEKYTAGQPWQAYRQFCQHFLAPLMLAAYTDLRLSQMLRINLDGVPLDLAVKLLPKKSKFKLSTLIHIVWHARAQKSRELKHKKSNVKVSQKSQEAILDSLERSIKKLHPKKEATEWSNYYDKTNYSQAASDQKSKILENFVKPLKAKTAIDLGGNNGRYCRVLNNLGLSAVCVDIDPNAVEANYLHAKKRGETKMLPLVIDLTNPGGGLGWQNKERTLPSERLKADVALALALVHHLAISNNLPFGYIAEYFTQFAPHLVIEFVPKDDSQVQKLLSSRRDIFPDYSEESFEKKFGFFYKILKKNKIKNSKRTLYLLERT